MLFGGRLGPVVLSLSDVGGPVDGESISVHCMVHEESRIRSESGRFQIGHPPGAKESGQGGGIDEWRYYCTN